MWSCVNVYGRVCMCVVVCECVWSCVNAYGRVCMCMASVYVCAVVFDWYLIRMSVRSGVLI